MGSPHYEIGRDKFFDRQERAKLLKTCRDKAELDEAKGRSTWPVRYMLVDLALFSGLRVAEIAALKVGDLALKAENPYLTVQRGKGGKRRTVYLDKELVRHLKSYIKLHLHGPDPESPLFPGRGGNRHCQPITLMKSFKRAVEEAGLPGHYSIHCARHTYATYLLHDTGNLRYVQKQLGHAQIAMTALYADVLPEENGKLANMIRRDET
ncbi:MAG: tyrosine-type recombinase/integrase [Thermodesulfobacteriota bacterium]